MIKKCIIPLSLVFLLIACNGPNFKKMGKESQLIQKTQYNIPDSVYSFFSDINDYTSSMKLVASSTNAIIKNDTLPFHPTLLNTSFIFKIYEFSDFNKKKDLINKYSNCLFSTYAENKDYSIIFEGRELIKYLGENSTKENLSNLNINNTIPLFTSLTKVDPRFTSSKNLCGLKDGYIIKVLHSGNEFVLPEHRKFEWDILPTDMHHGYLSGIAHKENEPYIIYWVIAW